MIVALVSALLLASALPALAADPAAAERQYRIARRLAAEGSPEAAAALRRVVELDPDGAWSDDALVDEASLGPIPHWPGEIGRLEIIPARTALALLDRVLEREAPGDRAAEARYLRALLRLEPLPGHDPSAALLDLTAVGMSGGPSPWTGPARHAMAWLHERRGDDERALAAYQRLVVDDPHGDVGGRARVGLARVLVRRGEYGAAARWLQEAIDMGVPRDAGAENLRELAVRRLLREFGAPDTSARSEFVTGIRGATALAPTPGGGVLLLDAKQGRVVQLDRDGVQIEQWVLEDPQAVGVDLLGRKFAAAADAVVRLEPQGRTVSVASLGDYAPVSGLAIDGSGGFWLLGRRGRTIGRIAPGEPGPRAFLEDEGFRFGAVAWDGRQLVAIETRQKIVVVFDRTGRPRSLLTEAGSKPVAIAADAAGVLVVLDGKSAQVTYLPRNGKPPVVETLADVGRAVAIGLGADGALHVFDGADGKWVVLR